MKDIIFLGFVCFLILAGSSCSSKVRMQKFEEVERNAPLLQDHNSVLQQNYTDIRQFDHCGREPIVRFVSFSFDKKDSLSITIEITTSTSEKRIEGSLLVLTDDYELDYANTPTSKLYVETTDVEVESRNPNNLRSNGYFLGRIISSALPKETRKVTEKQYWNAFTIHIEKLDIPLLSSSSEIEFIIPTETCELSILPSRQQMNEINTYLKK